MRLTTLTRLKRRVPVTTTQHDTLLESLIFSVSAEVEAYLDRHMLRTARTEQFDVFGGTRVYWVKGYPVASSPAPQLRFDVDRAFTGAAEDASNFYVRNEDGRIEVDFGYARGTNTRYPGALQIISTGGMAPSLDTLTAAASAFSGAFTASEVLTGGTSGATGVFTSSTATTITLRVTNGVFEEGETITGSTSGVTVVLGAATATPLVMAYPDVVMAAEMLMATAFQRRDQIGLTSYSAEGGSISFFETPLGMDKHAQAILERYRNLGRSR